MSSVMKSMKVLAVDDNRTNLHILQVFLKKLGHEVILAENGEEAVRRFAADHPDLVLLDIMMPIMDGFEAARQIKKMSQERWTPIIFLSALNRDENLVEGLDAGADDYLTKPINFIVLEAKLRSMQRSLALQQTSIDSLRRTQAISDNVLDAIITLDEAGVILSANRSAERIFGWLTADICGMAFSDLVPMGNHPAEAAPSGFGQPLNDSIFGREREVYAQRQNGERFIATVAFTQLLLDNQHIIIAVMRDISERKAAEQKLKENAEQLQAYYEHTQSEQLLAMRLMEKQLHRNGLKDDSLHYTALPAENFCGDIVAANRHPDGRLYALLADATGHGLSAAISALPVLALFYQMTKSGRSVREIVLELNLQLLESMPLGRFVAASVVCLDQTSRQGEIWIGGTPSVLVVNREGEIDQCFDSLSLPLGIIDFQDSDATPRVFNVRPNSQILLCSDGLLEAENEKGVQFGADGLKSALAGGTLEERFVAIQKALKHHLGQCHASDDVSLMLIDCL